MGMFKYTYGYEHLIKNDVRNCPHFMFDWLAYTRTKADIEKRCNYLITLFKKELGMPEFIVQEKEIDVQIANSKTK